MNVLKVGVLGVGLAAPGLPNWQESLPVLRGEKSFVREEMQRYAPTLLPPNERRRATAVGRLAFQSAEEAVSAVNGQASELASVFASSGGDTDIVNAICTALATEERLVSPTHFHNSVHNAPAGYWSIATHSHGASSSLSAFDGSFAAGLVEAATLALCEGVDVLLATYDVAVTAPLNEKRPINESFTSALIISADTSQALGCIELKLVDHGTETRMQDQGLESLRTGNPAGRALPLLKGLAQGGKSEITLPALDGLFVDVTLEA